MLEADVGHAGDREGMLVAIGPRLLSKPLPTFHITTFSCPIPGAASFFSLHDFCPLWIANTHISPTRRGNSKRNQDGHAGGSKGSALTRAFPRSWCSWRGVGHSFFPFTAQLETSTAGNKESIVMKLPERQEKQN